MSHVRLASSLAALSLLAVLALSPVAPAQVVVETGDIGIVTTAGFLRLRSAVPQSLPVNQVLPVAFGLASLVTPSVAWMPGTDDFYVATGPNIFRVTILSDTTASVTDLSPGLGGGSDLRHLDIHQATGALFVQDTAFDQAFRFSPPFAQGMVPDLLIDLPGGVRGMAVDTRHNPPSVVYATSTEIVQLTYGGNESSVTLDGASGLDDDPVIEPGTVYCIKNENVVNRSTGSPMLVQNLNLVEFCSPIALGPRNVFYHPTNYNVYVFAEDGVNAGCLPGVSGPNHVVKLPPAIGPVPPKVITNPSNSGVGGTHGDLTIVTSDFPYPSPYGLACNSLTDGKRPVMDAGGTPAPGFSNFTFEISKAPPNQAVFVSFGLSAGAFTLPSGCTYLVDDVLLIFFAGAANGNGKLTIPAPLPASIPTGFDLFFQAGMPDLGQVVFSNGLQLHFAD